MAAHEKTLSNRTLDLTEDCFGADISEVLPPPSPGRVKRQCAPAAISPPAPAHAAATAASAPVIGSNFLPEPSRGRKRCANAT
jgi:hypothetical protein